MALSISQKVCNSPAIWGLHVLTSGKYVCACAFFIVQLCAFPMNFSDGVVSFSDSKTWNWNMVQSPWRGTETRYSLHDVELKRDTVSVKTKQTIMDDTIHTIIALSWEKEYVVVSNNFTAKATPFSFPCLDARNQALCRLYTYLTVEKRMRSPTDAAVDALWGCGQDWGRKDCALNWWEM